MEFIEWLQATFRFLDSEEFVYVYGLVVFANPFAILPQLISSIRSEPEKLGGVSVGMFVIFMAIQTAIALGAIKALDLALFLSMSVSAVISLFVIVVTLYRRRNA